MIWTCTGRRLLLRSAALSNKRLFLQSMVQTLRSDTAESKAGADGESGADSIDRTSNSDGVCGPIEQGELVYKLLGGLAECTSCWSCEKLTQVSGAVGALDNRIIAPQFAVRIGEKPKSPKQHVRLRSPLHATGRLEFGSREEAERRFEVSTWSERCGSDRRLTRRPNDLH